MTQTTAQPVKVGAIFSMSWGYDQTNVNYFQVVRTTPKGVYVREIGASRVEGTEGRDCCDVQPSKDRFLEKSSWCGGYSDCNPETFRRIQFSGRDNQPYFNFKGRYFAHLVSEGESTYCSWYH